MRYGKLRCLAEGASAQAPDDERGNQSVGRGRPRFQPTSTHLALAGIALAVLVAALAWPETRPSKPPRPAVELAAEAFAEAPRTHEAPSPPWIAAPVKPTPSALQDTDRPALSSTLPPKPASEDVAPDQNDKRDNPVTTRPTRGHAVDAQRLYERGVELYRLERFTEAVQSLERSVELQDDRYEPYFYLGNALTALGDYIPAVGAYERCVALSPLPAAYHNMGVAYAELGMAEQSMAAYRSAIERDPGHAPSRFNLGSMCLQQGRHEAAREQADALAAIDPDLAGQLRTMSLAAASSRPAN